LTLISRLADCRRHLRRPHAAPAALAAAGRTTAMPIAGILASLGAVLPAAGQAAGPGGGREHTGRVRGGKAGPAPDGCGLAVPALTIAVEGTAGG
jgi:hypothetical protein